MPNNPFILTMEPLIFNFRFFIEGHNVFVTIEFFPHIDVVVVESTLDPYDRDTPGFLELKTFLNLLNN